MPTCVKSATLHYRAILQVDTTDYPQLVLIYFPGRYKTRIDRPGYRSDLIRVIKREEIDHFIILYSCDQALR